MAVIRIHSRKKVVHFLTYEQAREVVRNKNFTSITKFRRWLKKEKNQYANIPAIPEEYYAQQGFTWEDFLGDSYIEQCSIVESRSNISYPEVRRFAHSLNIVTKPEWMELAAQGKLPPDVPARPDIFFKRRGTWTGWVDFLNADHNKKVRMMQQQKAIDEIAEKENEQVAMERITFVLPFAVFRENVRKQNFNNKQQYYDWCKLNKMYGKGYPINPDKVYMTQGVWTDWFDLLGIYNPNTPTFSVKCSYIEAKKFAQSLNLRTEAQWRQWCLEHPDTRTDVPRYPDKHYGEYWENWSKFLGTNVIDRLSEDLYKISVLWIAKPSTKYNNVYHWDIETKGLAATYDEVCVYRDYELVALFKFEDRLLTQTSNLNTRNLVEQLVARYTDGEAPGSVPEGVIINNIWELLSDLKYYFDSIEISIPDHIKLIKRKVGYDHFFEETKAKTQNKDEPLSGVMDML